MAWKGGRYKYRSEREEQVRRGILLIISYILVFYIGYTFAYQTLVSETQPEVLTPMPVLGNFTGLTNILAVRSTDNVGVIGDVIVEVNPGKGRVLMDTNPFVEPDTQYSAETAVSVAQGYTKMDLGDRDVIISFNITGQLIGGPSAGAAITIATVGAIEKRPLKEDVAITGTIESNGEIGYVGGLVEKAEAAANNGIKLFLVPEGQIQLRYYEQVIERERITPGFVIRRVKYIPRILDLANYTMTEWGMETKEVATIDDVVTYMLK